MLQIASGRFFKNDPGQRNELRGVAYTNLRLADPIETTAGNLLPTSNILGATALIYEMTELLEQSPAPGVRASSGIDPYLEDFSVIVSFFLRATCTSSLELTSQLTRTSYGVPGSASPKKLVPRVFDEGVSCGNEDVDLFAGFVDHLLRLKRKHYIAVFQAIKSYVHGLQQVAKNSELAYTLLVASIESLAQNFKQFTPVWKDYESGKRKRIEDALREADWSTSKRIKEAILKNEHAAISRRFLEFSDSYLTDAYFEESPSAGMPDRSTLRKGLKGAYSVRSRYIHNLKSMPKLLKWGLVSGDLVEIEGKIYLSFAGMARLARHIIIEFANRQEELEEEEYDYSKDIAGVIRYDLKVGDS